MPEESMDLRKFVAPEFIFGVGARRMAGRYARNMGVERVLLVTDEGVMRAGWAGEAMENLSQLGVEPVLYQAVSANPRDYQVMEGLERYRAGRCQGIVAVGGGSPMDCAKGIAIVATNPGHIRDYEGVDRIEHPIPPLLCIPTTAGTSADVSQFAIISHMDDRRKFAIISKAIIPDVALIDPVTLTTMSAQLTAATGLDALVHAVEAFVSTGHSMITDVHALEAVGLIHRNLVASVADPANMEKRTLMMQASLQAGLAFSNASLGAVHALSHSLGGLLDLPHGECNAMLLDHVVAFNFQEAGERYTRVAQVMGLSVEGSGGTRTREAVLGEIRRLRAEAGIVATLADKGVSIGDLGGLAENALADPCLVTNPRRAGKEDLRAIYEEAL